VKLCSSCNISKPYSDFESDSRYKSGYRSQCTYCNRKGKTLSSLGNNLKKYGITLEQYNFLLDSQKGVCKICQEKETRVTRPKAKISMGYEPRLAVDHDHKNGEVRGLLCHRCNVGLGNFQDNPELLLKAYKYLKDFK